MPDKRFYLVFAYPTTSGALHVGHIRSYTLPDIIAKYHISKGENVFFPLGFHATGSDAIKIFDAIKSDPSKARNYGLSKNDLDKINGPKDVVRSLISSYIHLFKKAGFSLNYNAAISTIDPAYSKVIEWQFRKLHKLGYLIQKDYPLPWCPKENQPVHLDASEADIMSFKGNKVIKFNLVLFDGDLPILGYTADLGILGGPICLEINSKVNYVEALIDNKNVVVSDRALDKLTDLGRKVEKIKDISIEDIANLNLQNPLTGEQVKVVKSEFDAPDGTDIRIVSSIPIKKNREHEDKGEEEKIYRELEKNNKIDFMYDLSAKPIYCRCGAEVVIKTIKNQWFIDYGNKEWKESAKELVEQISTFPSSYKNELYNIIDWLGPRPCVRRTGLGTEFPFEKGWIIEALSDSNIYMAIYIISEAVNLGKITVDSISDKLLDYVFLGTGKASEVSEASGLDINTINSLKEEFEITYPLDVNFGGVEHKSVHFPFFIFNHAAIFPKKYWPKGIFLNWHVIINGEKMSKHLGNFVSWDDALDQYGVDAVRLYIASGADQWSIFDWKNQIADETKKQLDEFVSRTQKLIMAYANQDIKINDETIFDQWLLSKLNSSIKDVTAHLDKYEIRPAVIEALSEMNSYLESYISYNRINNKVIEEFLKKQLLMLYPFIPNASIKLLADLRINLNKIKWPGAEPERIDKKLEKMFESLDNTIKDLNTIKKIKGKYQSNTNVKCYLYVSTDEEKELYEKANNRLSKTTGISNISVFKSGEATYDPENKATRARPFKPAIFIADE